MKLLNFHADGDEIHLGVVHEDNVADLTLAAGRHRIEKDATQFFEGRGPD